MLFEIEGRPPASDCRRPEGARPPSSLFRTSSSEVGVDEGGCAATRARARCACRSQRIWPAASTPATPANAAKRGHGPVAHDARWPGDAVGCASGDEQVDRRRVCPALLFDGMDIAQTSCRCRIVRGEEQPRRECRHWDKGAVLDAVRSPVADRARSRVRREDVGDGSAAEGRGADRLDGERCVEEPVARA